MVLAIANKFGESHTAPQLYSAGQGIALVADGIPMDVADQSFNRKFLQAVVGNGSYGGPNAAGSAGGWTETSNTAAGSIALDNAGSLVLTTATTDESNENLQFLAQPFRYSTTKRCWVFGRFSCSTAITTDFYFGLFESQTAIVVASAIAATDDSIGFFKAATATDLTFRVAKGGTATTQAMGLLLTDAAYFLCGFTIINGVIRPYAALDPNDAFTTNPGAIGLGKTVVNTNAPNTVDTFFSLVAGQEGGTTARTVTCPWAFACAEHA